MVDDDTRKAVEQLPMSFADRPHALQRRAIGDHEEVVVGGRVRVGSKPLDAVEEVVQRRDRVRAHGIGLATERLDEMDDRKRRSHRVAIGVLVADGEHPTRVADPLDHDIGHDAEVDRQVERHPCFRWAGRPVGRPRRRRGLGGMTAEGGSSAESPS